MRCQSMLARLVVLAMVLGWMLASESQAKQPAQFKQPNVLVLLADDAGWGDFGFNGNQQLATPNIDRIAREGAVFDRFYVCPVCSPTRAEWLTGRYHLRGGVVGVSTGQERLDLDERTIADSFRSAGYVTGAFGKWHNGSQWPYHPMARGFDEYFGHTSGHWGEYFDPELEDNGKMVRTRGYIVDICTDRAIDFIDRHHDQPFFCYVPFTTPHSPWAVPQEDWLRFQDKTITQFATVRDRENFDETRCALAMVENQDRNIGRILNTLDRHNLLDDTIIVYFSDNGPNTMRFNGQMKGKKGTTDEGGVRTAAFLRWPRKVQAGTWVPQIAGAIDLLPTLVALTGVERVGDKPLDGLDLTPLLVTSGDVLAPRAGGDKGDEDQGGDRQLAWPQRMIFSTWAGRTSVRTDRFRLDDQGRLFDMVADPGQTTDVSATFAEIAAQLRESVVSWDAEMKSEAIRKRVAGDDNANRPRSQVDPRPIPVGFKEFPITILPARDGEPLGNVKRSSNAPNSSYFVNWKSVDDAIVWNVAVENAGRYEVTIDYTCPLEDVGSEIELGFQDASLRGTITRGWDPPLYDNQDTLPRPPAESKMKPFRTMRLGEIDLPSGAGPLKLRATTVPGQSVMDLRRMTLTYIVDRPNVLWITSEDNSCYLGCYGDEQADTPNLDRLAAQGVRYRHAFANAPVCSTARSTLITGMHASALGIHNHRSRVAIPDRFLLYPELLRAAGYYCSNRSKEDYNVPTRGKIWDQSSPRAHYRNRQSGQPFFAVFNFTSTHEGQVAAKADKDDFRVAPEQIQLPPYHPDTLTIRRDWANYYDQMTLMDSQVGDILRELDESGEADNTIVFYYSDHGGALPGGKRSIRDVGTRVPLIVRFPEKWQHLAPAPPGQWVDRPVSFVDLPATLLSLCNVDIPDHFQGNAFLGNRLATPQPFVYLFRGRMDERFDTVRSLRTAKHRYVKNYSPHRPEGQHYTYAFTVQPSMRSWFEEFREGRCNPTQSRYWLPKASEEFYDVESDPDELNNLAMTQSHVELDNLRQQLRDQIISLRDVGFIPEGMMAHLAGQATIYQYAQSDDYPIEQIVDLANKSTSGDRRYLSDFIRATDDPHPVMRYWAATGFLVLKQAATSAKSTIANRLDDDALDVRVVAAEAIAHLGEVDQAIDVLAEVLGRGNPYEVLAAQNAIEALWSDGLISLARAQQVLASDIALTEPTQRIPQALARASETDRQLSPVDVRR